MTENRENQKNQKNHGKQHISVIYAVFAAVLFGLSTPFSKILLNFISPMLMATFLYLGAGLGMLILRSLRSLRNKEKKESTISSKELPYTLSMILLDIAAPILLMIGLTSTNSSTISLLMNAEIVATTIIARIFFKESIGKRLWIAISFIIVASCFLSLSSTNNIVFSPGALFCILACLCWGLENNCTRMMSLKDPSQIVIIKGISSGIGSLVVAYFFGDWFLTASFIPFAMGLGFVSYGLSIFFYVFAQRKLGAARTSSFYATAPFIGVLLSIMLLKEEITWNFIIGLVLMIIGTYFVISENHIHTHLHRNFVHDHRHSHNDGHHGHKHPQDEPALENGSIDEEHTHNHKHNEQEHSHKHTPDLHHDHSH